MNDREYCQSLFDTAARSDATYMKRAESIYSFLNRSEWSEKEQIRKLLEQWFYEYPPNQKNDVCSRFRSKDDLQHCAAFFELYCSALLHGQEFRINAHPNTSKGTRPEFIAYDGNTPLFYLEARISTPGNVRLRNQKQSNLLADALISINSPYFHIHVSIMHSPTKVPSELSVSKVKSFVEYSIKNQGHPEPVKLLSMQKDPRLPLKQPWIEGEWEIRLSLRPKSLERQKQLESSSLSNITFPAERSAEVEQLEIMRLRKAIDKKARHYGELELPYIVAINSLNPINERVQNEALYGNEGLWSSYSIPDQQPLSAVLFVSGLSYWTITNDSTPILWHNPFAKKPLSRETWQGTQILNENLNGVQRVEGKSARDLLKLSSNWPH